MNKDSKKIILVGILITVIIGFLIVWILVEDHHSTRNTGFKNSHATNNEQLNYNETASSKKLVRI
jgi:5-bromo-4-chloroindolyl phosphate hydrolysis protein